MLSYSLFFNAESTQKFESTLSYTQLSLQAQNLSLRLLVLLCSCEGYKPFCCLNNNNKKYSAYLYSTS